jgi:hypothetical protein
VQRYNEDQGVGDQRFIIVHLCSVIRQLVTVSASEGLALAWSRSSLAHSTTK